MQAKQQEPAHCKVLPSQIGQVDGPKTTLAIGHAQKLTADNNKHYSIFLNHLRPTPLPYNFCSYKVIRFRYNE